MNYLDIHKILLDGIELAALNVAKSYGPKSKITMIKAKEGAMVATRDGYSITQKTTSDEPELEFGLRLIKSISARMKKLCGDGTSSVTLLFYFLCKTIYDNLKFGYDEFKIKKIRSELIKSCNTILSKVQLDTEVNPTEDTLNRIATSATGLFDDSYLKLASNISTLVSAVEDGDIQIEPGDQTYCEVKTGCQRMITPVSNLLTDNLDKPIVYITNHNLDSLVRILPITQKCLEEDRSLLIICSSIDKLTLSQYESMISQGLFKGNLISVSLGSGYSEDFINDISFLSGAKVDFYDELKNPDDILDFMGSLDGYARDKNNHIFSHSIDTTEKLKELLLIDVTNNNSLKYRVESRLNFFRGKVGTLYIECKTEEDYLEKKFKSMDAISSVRSAMKYGTLPNIRKFLSQFNKLDIISKYAISNFINLLPDGNSIDPAYTIKNVVELAYTMAISYLDIDNLIIEGNKIREI